MSGIYKLTCNMRKMLYVGPNSRKLNQRYRENLLYVRNNDPQSAYAQHILQNLNEYGSVTDTMSLLKPTHKMSTMSNYLFKNFHHNGNLITEQAKVNKIPYFSWPLTPCLWQQPLPNKSRSVHHSQHTQTSSNSSTTLAGSSNGYVHHSLCNRTYCIIQQNILHYSTEHIALFNRTYCIIQQNILHYSTEHTALFNRTYCIIQQNILHYSTEHTALFNRTYCIFHRNTLSTTTVIPF